MKSIWPKPKARFRRHLKAKPMEDLVQQVFKDRFSEGLDRIFHQPIMATFLDPKENSDGHLLGLADTKPKTVGRLKGRIYPRERSHHENH